LLQACDQLQHVLDAHIGIRAARSYTGRCDAESDDPSDVGGSTPTGQRLDIVRFEPSYPGDPGQLRGPISSES
jgi:hypothetical protein